MQDLGNLHRQTDIIASLEDKTKEALILLKNPDELWYPSDFLPDISKEDWHDRYNAFREQAKNVRLPLLSVLIGNTLTEEALPTYMSWLNRFEGIKDKTGVDQHPWAIWLRSWTAEEDRHGALLSAYLSLNPNVDFSEVGKAQYDLIVAGFEPKTGKHPYNALVYTSFQERATRISHQNTGLLAGKDGDEHLRVICVKIAADEARHETFYSTMMKHVFDIDANGAMLAYQEMMNKQIGMPAERLRDRKGVNIFAVFSAIAQAENIYTAHDYAHLIDHFNKQWDIANRKELLPDAQQAQEFLMSLPVRYSRLAERVARRLEAVPSEQLPWIRKG
jgi:acyl-[acyl-carrier-protein] desaturase